MKKFYTFLIALLFLPGLNAQSCLPDGIYLESQAQIDQFKADFPGCTEIEGFVEIEGSGITNLDSLHQITSIGGYLEIYDVPDLVSIEGLSALTSIGEGRLAFFSTALTDFHGLENLSYIPALRIDGNMELTSLQGFDALTASPGGLYIVGNPVLSDLSSLENLTDIGTGGNLYITENESLTSLSGLDNVVFNSAYVLDVWIRENPLLSECDVASICNLLNDNVSVSIGSNATGCNSKDEVKAECETSIDELGLAGVFTVYPNPAYSKLTIEVHKLHSVEAYFTLIGTNGQEFLSSSIQETTEVDISHLPTGVYILKVWNDNDVLVQKVIKE